MNRQNEVILTLLLKLLFCFSENFEESRRQRRLLARPMRAMLADFAGKLLFLLSQFELSCNYIDSNET